VHADAKEVFRLTVSQHRANGMKAVRGRSGWSLDDHRKT
jgi:hypothetical protein